MEVQVLLHTIMGRVFQYSGKHQIGVAALPAGAFALGAVPLELLRRAINSAIKSIRKTLLGALACLGVLPAAASAAVISGTHYGTQYDYGAFVAATDGKRFHVVLGGNAFPGTDPGAVARDLLPVLQAAKPPPALTFTYEAPQQRPRPNHHLVLIFDPPTDLKSSAVCTGDVRFKSARPGVFTVLAVYCRNDEVMSETIASTPATNATDPRIGQLFREVFMVLFSDSPGHRPGHTNERR